MEPSSNFLASRMEKSAGNERRHQRLLVPLLIWSIYYAKTGITRFKTGRNRVPLATHIVGVASVDASETNDVRLDKAHKVSLVPIEKLVDGPRSKISSSGGRRNRLFSFNRCTVFTRVANRRERSNIREPVAERSVGRELNQSKEIKSKLKSVAGRYRFRAGEKEMGRGLERD